MRIDKRSFINFLRRLPSEGICYVFFVDASSPMLLQKASFGDWSRNETAIQLITRQIYSLSKADLKAGKNNSFLLIGFNSVNAFGYVTSSKKLLKYYDDPCDLATCLVPRMKKLGGPQNTNAGFALMKEVLDNINQNRFVSGSTSGQTFWGKTKIRGTEKGIETKFYLFTDAGDACNRNLENPFVGYDSDPLTAIFVGTQKDLSGKVALRQTLSKCPRHREKRLFSLDEFKDFSQIESAEFLSFDQEESAVFCPSCLEKNPKTHFFRSRKLVSRV